MIFIYFKQELPWILLFCLFNISILLLGLLDTEIPNLAVIYIVVINLVFFIIFLTLDYYKGKKYRIEFMNMESVEDIDSLPAPVTPYQKTMDERLEKIERNYYEKLEKESKKTEENLDEMTRWIHDMKMPMTTMKLMIDDLKKPEGLRIEEEWLRLDAMLNEMLYDKRLSNISNDLYIENTEIEKIITNTLRKLKTLCIEKGIGIDLDLNVTHIETDIKWLSFIVDQIIGNSVKYSNDEDITITSYLKEGWSVLQISDAGRGIRNEDLPRIFEAGFTSTSNHEDRQSTGMGLYLTKEAADAMGIELNVESEYGRGTTTIMVFPKKNEYQHVMTM